MQHLVGGDECGDRDVLLPVVRQCGVPRAEVHGIDPPGREVGNVRPRLLGMQVEAAGP